MLHRLLKRWLCDEGRWHEVQDENFTLRFHSVSGMEQMRIASIFSKEPGTVKWIRSCVKPGDVFFDIGANIGIYALMAAARAGSSGAVHCFEPHVLNVGCLLRNIGLNAFATNVRVHSSPLYGATGFVDFHYHSLEPGSAFSQVNQEVDHEGKSFKKQATERKYAVTLDDLIEAREVPPPTHIKIDVDGVEPDIVRGMRRLLCEAPPQTIQVEVSGALKIEITRLLGEAGYAHQLRHDTAGGLKQINAGADPDAVAHNVIFSPRPIDWLP